VTSIVKIGLSGASIVASAALFLGCGGGSGDEQVVEPAPPAVEEQTITQSELIEDGDRICAEVNAAIGTIESSSTASPTTVQSQLATIYEGLADRLEELGKPTDGPAPVAVIAAARALGQPGEGSAEEFRQAAGDYGLDACAREPEAPDSTGSGSSDAGEATTPPPAPTPPPTPPAPTPSDGGGGGSGGSQSGGISPG
jgi:hypothetical protein